MSFSSLRRHIRPYSPRPWIHQTVFRRPLRLDLPQPIASFTFDDFPRSALHTGGPLLRRHDAHGTYYASLGLMGAKNEGGPLFTREDIDDLIANGHELGCHTFSHLPARRTDMAVFESDILKNRRRMEEILPGYVLQNFAYPGGELTLRLKRRMRQYAVSSRGTYTGINRHWADLDLLLSQNLYESVPLQHVKDVVDECHERPGWIIFYGHDVREQPSPCGCTPGYLEAVLQIVSDTCRIMTVREALAFIRGGSKP